MATHTHQDTCAFPPVLRPGNQLIKNIKEAWKRVNMGTLLKNSAIIAITVSFGKIVFSILAAFAFTHFRFKGDWLLFPLCMVTQMMPLPVRVVPLYRMMANFNWLNTYRALTIPYLASTTGIILFRQFYMTVPQELADAARVDGATPLQYLWRILIPLSWTNIAALLVIEFVYMWNEYLWPNIATTARTCRSLKLDCECCIHPSGCRMEYYHGWNADHYVASLIVLILFRKQFAQELPCRPQSKDAKQVPS